MIAVIVAASLLIGVSLGILGGGGSILTVPILVYLAGLEAKQAIATSLFVVGVPARPGQSPMPGPAGSAGAPGCCSAWPA